MRGEPSKRFSFYILLRFVIYEAGGFMPLISYYESKIYWIFIDFTYMKC